MKTENEMAIQPVDRKNAKHNLNVAPRKAPSMVNRRHKQVLRDITSTHVQFNRFNEPWFDFAAWEGGWK